MPLGQEGRKQDSVESEAGNSDGVYVKGDDLLYSAAGNSLDAPRRDRDAPVHQLTAASHCVRAARGETRLAIDRQDPPWKIVRSFRDDRGGTLVHLHNVSGGVLGATGYRWM